MRVAIVTSSYWPIVGGQMIYARDLARELVRQGHAVTVATRFTSRLRRTTWESLTEVDPEDAYDEDGVKVRVIRPGRLRRLALFPVHRLHYYEHTEAAAIRLFRLALTKALDQALGPCDVIHFNGVGRELFGFCAEAVARRRNVPFVITTHMHPGTWGDSRLDFRLYRKADRILAHTRWEGTVYIQGGLNPNRVEVVGIGVEAGPAGNPQRARNRYGLGSPVILFVGRKAQYKGFGLLLEAARIVWREVPCAQFVFVGPDQDQPSPEQARVLADPRVIETGTVSDADRNDLYAACTMLCVPSSAESFGLIYFEAWRHAKPVIALDIPPLREIIGGCGGGVLVREPDARLVADAIIQLVKDPDTRIQMGNAGADLTKVYAPHRVASRIAEIYSTCACEADG